MRQQNRVPSSLAFGWPLNICQQEVSGKTKNIIAQKSIHKQISANISLGKLDSLIIEHRQAKPCFPVTIAVVKHISRSIMVKHKRILDHFRIPAGFRNINLTIGV